MRRVSVVFVCLGNICRSPTAEGVFRKLVESHGLMKFIEVDSAGTSNWHVGERPDSRAIDAARSRGYDLSGFRGRQATASDFASFDYVLAMDEDNYTHLESLASIAQSDKLHLFLDFAKGVPETEVPDPYFGSAGGFPHVLDLIENASQGLLDHIVSEYG